MKLLVAVSGKHALVRIVLEVLLDISIELLVYSDDGVLDRSLVTGFRLLGLQVGAGEYDVG